MVCSVVVVVGFVDGDVVVVVLLVVFVVNCFNRLCFDVFISLIRRGVVVVEVDAVDFDIFGIIISFCISLARVDVDVELLVVVVVGAFVVVVVVCDVNIAGYK